MASGEALSLSAPKKPASNGYKDGFQAGGTLKPFVVAFFSTSSSLV
jgi:hypothetical protein